MTEDNYQPEGGDAQNSAAGGVSYANPVVQQAPAAATYTREDLKKDHTKGKQLLSGMVDGILGKRKTTGDLGKAVAKEDQVLSQAGINLDNVPDVFKSFYVRVYNMVNKPDTRFKDKREGIDNLIKELDQVSEEMSQKLFGSNYGSINQSEFGGLYGELLSSGEKRKEHADAIIGLEDEVNNTYQRIEQAKQLLGTVKDPKGKHELHKDLVGYHADLDSYKRKKEDISTNLQSLDYTINSKKVEIDGLKSLQKWVGRQAVEAKKTLAKYQKTSNNHEYLKSLTGLISQLDNNLQDFREIAKIFDQSQDRQQAEMASATKISVKNDTSFFSLLSNS